MGVASFERTQSMPAEKNRRPSGSTSHHLPLSFSVRKKPVASRFGPAAQPPNLSQSAAAALLPAEAGTPNLEASAASSLASISRCFCNSATEWILPGQSLCLYWPKVSTKGVKGLASVIHAVGG